MAGKESRQCPHFDIHHGVCGCPEFWKPAQRSQNDRQPSTPREVSNTRHDHSTPGNQFNSSVNSNSLPDRTKTKTQPVTPAPPGPPKETCFFWYHGSCRRGDDCDRPHEAHPTWPIPPPPGFRHYQPCTLPLCPLRTDLEAIKQPQQYQRRGRTMSGQMDGAAFSRATTAGESSSDNDSSNTDTDVGETNEEISMKSPDGAAGSYVQGGVALQILAEDARKEGADQDIEVKAQQKLGSHEFDQPDYIDLSQLFSPRSTTLVPGILSKRRQLPATNSPDIKLAEGTPPDISNCVSVLERPRNMSQWDVKPRGFSLDGSWLDPDTAHLTTMHRFSPQPLPMFATNSEPPTHAPQHFDPPKGPRSMDAVPPICFFYYHKGYCNPKRGRRCDYLHDTDTSQQIVSLPHGIDKHDPTCSLPSCPVRLQSLCQVKQEQDHFPVSMQPGIEHEPMTPPGWSDSPIRRCLDSSPRDMIMAVRGRHPKGMLGQPLPQLTGIARQRFKEQKRRIEQIQAEKSIDSTNVAVIVDAQTQARAKKKTHRSKRWSKKQARLRLEMEAEEFVKQGLNSRSDAFTMQRPLSSLSMKEETPGPNLLSPVGNPNKKRRGQKNRNKKPLHSQRAEDMRPGDFIEDEDIRGFTPEIARELNPSWTLQGFPSPLEAPDAFPEKSEKQASVDRALGMVDTMNQDARKWCLLTTHPQRTSSALFIPYEFSQESLGLTAEERRAQVHEERAARREAYGLEPQPERERTAAAPEGMAHLATSATSLSSQLPLSRPHYQRCHRSKEGCDGQRPCQRYTDADIGAGGCIDWEGGIGGKEFQVEADVATGNAVENRLPEGDQRLDWDTDLVRRLFGEIE